MPLLLGAAGAAAAACCPELVAGCGGALSDDMLLLDSLRAPAGVQQARLRGEGTSAKDAAKSEVLHTIPTQIEIATLDTCTQFAGLVINSL